MPTERPFKRTGVWPSAKRVARRSPAILSARLITRGTRLSTVSPTTHEKTRGSGYPRCNSIGNTNHDFPNMLFVEKRQLRFTHLLEIEFPSDLRTQLTAFDVANHILKDVVRLKCGPQ